MQDEPLSIEELADEALLVCRRDGYAFKYHPAFNAAGSLVGFGITCDSADMDRLYTGLIELAQANELEEFIETDVVTQWLPGPVSLLTIRLRPPDSAVN